MDKCVVCKTGEYKEVVYDENILVNPNGEYVKGYGHMPVYRMSSSGRVQCNNCRHIKGTKVIELSKEF